MQAMNIQPAERANPGLEGVVAAETRLSHVDGARGALVMAGHRLEDLADREFEDVVALLWTVVRRIGLVIARGQATF